MDTYRIQPYHSANISCLSQGCLEISLLEISYLETPLFKSILSISMDLPWSPKIDQGHPKGKEAHPSQPRKPSLSPEPGPQKVCACKILQAGPALLRSSDLLLYGSMVEVGGEGRTVPPSLDASLCYPGPWEVCVGGERWLGILCLAWCLKPPTTDLLQRHPPGSWPWPYQIPWHSHTVQPVPKIAYTRGPQRHQAHLGWWPSGPRTAFLFAFASAHSSLLSFAPPPSGPYLCSLLPRVRVPCPWPFPGLFLLEELVTHDCSAWRQE